MHTHFSRWQPSDDHVWTRMLRAEDLHAVNNMVYKQSGIREIIEPVRVGQKLGRRENYPLFASVCDWAHDQGGIAGWAHGGTIIKLMESLPVEAALGKLDFVENIQFNAFYGFMFWYRLLNCGIRLACTGGSDFPFSADILAPWYPNLGLDRTYVKVDGEFTYGPWIEGIRRGETFASNGPLLFLTVDGQPPGSQVNVAASESEVVVEARAVCNYGLDRIEIVQNGAVIKHVEGVGGQTVIACAELVSLTESSWLAARTRGRVSRDVYGGVAPWNLHAHSSPIYVLVDGKPIRRAEDLTAMADYIRMMMEWYRRLGIFAEDSQRAELTSNCEKALALYESGLRKV